MAALRQIEVPLAEVKAIIGLDPQLAAKRLSEYWAGVEVGHLARRDLANFLVERLSGKRALMYEVATRDIPARKVLCLKRHVDGWQGAWAFGKEFVGILKDRPMPRVSGTEGATFCIYYGDVSDDSDGPLEWCRPVPEDNADKLAVGYPDLTLRSEAAHSEAFVHLGSGGQTTSVQWQLVSEVLRTWSAEQKRPPSDLGVRVTYLVSGSVGHETGPDCDFVVPLA